MSAAANSMQLSFRDDFRTHAKPLSPNVNDMEFDVEGRMWCSWTTCCSLGRTNPGRASTHCLAHGRPNSVALAVLIDRRFSRSSPLSRITSETHRQHWRPARESGNGRRNTVWTRSSY
jgi:pyrimidine operon attenuation protein/uracil phosphoribosyltransferase